MTRDDLGYLQLAGLALKGFKVWGKQTLPMAETLGAHKTASLAEEACKIIGINASYVVRGLQGDASKHCALEAGANGDMWTRLLANKPRPAPRKVKSHLSFDEVLAGKCEVDLLNWVGNFLADAAPSAAHTLAMLEKAIVAETQKWQAITFTMALRIATIEAQFWGDDEALVNMPPLEAPLPRSIGEHMAAIDSQQVATQHLFQPCGERTRCENTANAPGPGKAPHGGC